MKLAALVLMFVASFFVGGVYRIVHDATPTPIRPPASSRASSTPTPPPSHRPGVVPWDSCKAHPNPGSCPIDPTSACPGPFVPHCFQRKTS